MQAAVTREQSAGWSGSSSSANLVYSMQVPSLSTLTVFICRPKSSCRIRLYLSRSLSLSLSLARALSRFPY